MAHTRIRKFNTKETYPEQKLNNDLCQAVVARGATVFVRGQIAPYKYPRAIIFANQLPRTETGKLQRFKLRRH